MGLGVSTRAPQQPLGWRRRGPEGGGADVGPGHCLGGQGLVGKPEGSCGAQGLGARGGSPRRTAVPLPKTRARWPRREALASEDPQGFPHSGRRSWAPGRGRGGLPQPTDGVKVSPGKDPPGSVTRSTSSRPAGARCPHGRRAHGRGPVTAAKRGLPFLLSTAVALGRLKSLRRVFAGNVREL